MYRFPYLMFLVCFCFQMTHMVFGQDQLDTHIDKSLKALSLYDEKGDLKLVFNELEKIEKFPRKSVANYLKRKILHSSDSWDKYYAIKYSGILQLTELKSLISSLHDKNIHLILAVYFYLYCIDNESNYLDIFKFFSEIDVGAGDTSQIIMEATESSLELLGWIFESEMLQFLELRLASGNLDAGLGEVAELSRDRIRYYINVK